MGPKTLDELLSLVPGLRKCRSLNAPMLRKMLDRAKGECTWCGIPVPKGRLTWCSQECVAAFELRCSTAGQSRAVIKRDQHICQLCGINVKEAERAAHDELTATGNWRERHEIRRKFGWSGNWFEVDHVVPVVEGGGLCGLEGLRLLCCACHKSETAALAKRRAKAAKAGGDDDGLRR